MNSCNLKNQHSKKSTSAFAIQKFEKILFLFFLFTIGFSIQQTEAQVLKKLGKKIERKVDQRVERKTDRAIDKALDKTETEAGKALESNP